MGKLTVLALRIVLAMGLAGSVFVQAVMVPLLARDLNEDLGPDIARVSVPVLVIVLLGILAVQVTMVCVWRLLTLVRADSIFTPRAFVWVDVSLAAVVFATVLVVTTLAFLITAPAGSPSIALLCLLGIVVGAGLSLLLVVLRGLLRKASQLEHDLSEVV